LSILHRLDSIISVELFATLAGLSLVALSITAIAWELRERRSQNDGTNPQRSLSDEERRREVLEQYFGMGYFVSSVTIFVLGLVLTLIFDSLGGKYHDNLAFELSNVIPTGLLVV